MEPRDRGWRLRLRAEDTVQRGDPAPTLPDGVSTRRGTSAKPRRALQRVGGTRLPQTCIVRECVAGDGAGGTAGAEGMGPPPAACVLHSRTPRASGWRRVQLRGGARRPGARRSLSTLSVRSRAPTKQMGPYPPASGIRGPSLRIRPRRGPLAWRWGSGLRRPGGRGPGRRRRLGSADFG